MPERQATERVRTAEVIAALCLGTDLGMGFPFEHGLHTTLIAMRLADRLDVGRETASQTYYASLLSHAGCITDAHVTVEVFGGSLTTHLNPMVYGSGRQVIAGLVRALPDPERPAAVRAAQTARRLPRLLRAQRPQLTAHCEVAQMLADGVGASSAVRELLAHLLERWDGRGPLGRAEGEGIPLPMRIVHVATDAALQRLLGGVEHAARLVRERAGKGLDPEIAVRLADDAAEVLALDRETSTWDEALACEPQPRPMLEGEAIDRALAAMGAFTDLISPYLTGHSAGVAELASAGARSCRVDALGVTAIRRAGLVHDLGRVAVHPRIWQKPGPLTADEWEQVRLHPYHTERVLSRSPFLSGLAGVAGAHHERLDGSGYHRGCPGADLPLPARLLAAADAYRAMCEPRPYRHRISAEQAAEELAGEASAGRLDADAVTAVIEAAGQRAPRLERPAGLTEREAEVVAMLARGLQTKQARASSGSRSRPPTATSRTPTRRSGSRPAPPRRCSRWSTASSHGENSRLPGRQRGRSVVRGSTTRRARTHTKEDGMTTDTLDAFRGANYEIAEAIAPTWERRRADIEEIATPVREWMLRDLRAEEGDTVLELAAGVGDTGFEAAAIAGERGRLITSDFSPAMLDAARRRGTELGVANVEYRVIDAERIELDDDSVDRVLCRFGYMLMADPGAALAETRRVLRPGGRLTLAVWGAPERNPFFGIIAVSLIQRGHIDPPEPPPAPGIFSMASAERTEGLLRGAGFGEVHTEEVPGRFVLPDVDEYLAVIADTAGQIALALRGLADRDRAALKAGVEDSFGRFAAGGGYELPCVALCAVAS